MKQLEIDFGQWVVRRRWWIVAATLLLVALAASGARFLTFNTDNRVFFSADNPQLKALEDRDRSDNRIDNLLFVVAPENGNVFTRETLSAIEELTQAAWKIPYSSRVDSVTNFQHTTVIEDDLIVRDLAASSLSLGQADVDRIRSVALAEPDLVNRLVSPAGHVSAINVTILLPGESMEEVSKVASYVRNLADETKSAHPGIEI